MFLPAGGSIFRTLPEGAGASRGAATHAGFRRGSVPSYLEPSGELQRISVITTPAPEALGTMNVAAARMYPIARTENLRLQNLPFPCFQSFFSGIASMVSQCSAILPFSTRKRS